jgi:hypothetical protein
MRLLLDCFLRNDKNLENRQKYQFYNSRSIVAGSINNEGTGWETNISFLSPTIFVYLLPFLEKQAIYDLISDDYVNSPANNAWWDALLDKKSMIISLYICPSRGSRATDIRVQVIGQQTGS